MAFSITPVLMTVPVIRMHLIRIFVILSDFVKSILQLRLVSLCVLQIWSNIRLRCKIFPEETAGSAATALPHATDERLQTIGVVQVSCEE